MKRMEFLYRLIRYSSHYLTAFNSRGGGVHSPYLFELVHYVMRDNHSYYIWKDIENLRYELRCDKTMLDYIDFGSQGSPFGVKSKRLVSEVAKKSLEDVEYAQLLFRLVNWLGEQKSEDITCNSINKGLNIIELGTSLGITTAYLASASSLNNVISFEGCPALVTMARKVWKTLGLNNIQCIEGNIDQTFLTNPFGDKEVDVAFIDANHTRNATCQYFTRLLDYLNSASIVVIDDIHYSHDMAEAWKWIQNNPSVTTTMDLYKVGIVFFDTCYLRKHYKIRL